jgi:molybdate transport system substrate-binding protein
MIRRLVIGLALALSAAHAADTLRIAAAANLVYALAPLNAAFQSAAPGVKIETVIGSSGNLVAQITQGAPFDVFLSADMEYPRALIANGRAVAASLTPFANGRLVLWTTRRDLPLTALAETLRDPSVRRLALANPATAPYGRAARQVIDRLGLGPEVEPRIVVGENISQTAQFVASGNADAGFVALSLVLSPKLGDHGRWLEIPAADYTPLTQGAVLTAHGAGNAAAKSYLAFLRTPAARGILENFGYRVPRDESPGRPTATD